MQDNAADQLDLVMVQADDPACRFADGGKSIRQQVVERCPQIQLFPQPAVSYLSARVPASPAYKVGQAFNLANQRDQAFYLAIGMSSEDFFN